MKTNTAISDPDKTAAGGKSVRTWADEPDYSASDRVYLGHLIRGGLTAHLTPTGWVAISPAGQAFFRSRHA